jgi:NADPH:quinone reductase-like Zn-dependent oxidoreductase/acyl carrier protein
LPRLLSALREERIAAELLTADPARAAALLARLGAQRYVAVRDATRTPGPAPDLIAAVATLPLDPGPTDALAQLAAPGMERALLLFGVPPHTPAIDLLHGSEEGWWDQSPSPEAPVGLWPLPAETLRTLELAGRGAALRDGLDPSGAGLLLFDRALAPAVASGEPKPILVRAAAMSRARKLLPGIALRPHAPGEETELPAPVLIDVEAGPSGSEREALGRRILRLRDAAAELSRSPGARLVVLCEGAGAAAEAARALARTIANEYQAVTVSALVVAADAPRSAAAAALRAHLASGSAERELVVSAEGVALPRLRRARAPIRAPGLEERTVLRLGAPGLGAPAWELAPRRAPGRGEVEVEVAATGLNFRDVMLGLGLLDEEILGPGLTGGSLGFEFSGRVARVGAGGRMPWRVGDAVMGFAADAFASHLTVSAAQLLPAPRGLAIEAAAALPVAGTTAWHALVDRARLRRGETVLVHGGAGAVGLAALGIARALGARVIAAAGTAEKRSLLRRLGADAVVDSRAPDIEAELARVTDGVDVVLNSVAGDAMRETLRALKPFGRFVEIGKRDFLDNTRIGLRPFRHNIAYIGLDIDQLLAHAPRKALRAGRGFLRAVEARRVAPIPAQLLPGARIGDAFRLMQASGHVGKIVIRPEPRGQDRGAAPPRFAPAPGLHVVLGGTRGFGLAIALWLAERGAQDVVIVSRTGRPDQGDQARIDALGVAGRRIRAEALDVTDGAAMRAAFAAWRARHGRIAGVVHAAMVLSDGLLAGVTEEQLDAVLAPKLDGMRAAAAASAPDELQYFLACSSSAVVVGSPGQGAYVAANGFVEGAIRELRAAGVPALAVAWGVIEDVGVVARSRDLAERLRGSTGMDGISSRDALARLDVLLADPARAPVVSGYAVLRPTAAARRLATLRSPLFADVLGEAAAEAEEAVEAVEALDLAGLSPEAAEERLLDVVRGEIGQVLRLPVAEVEADRPLIELGLDSLMALELRLGLEKRTGIELSVLSAVGAAQTARRLAASLLPALRRGTAPEPAALPAPAAEAAAGRRQQP